MLTHRLRQPWSRHTFNVQRRNMNTLTQEAARELFLFNLGIRDSASIVRWADRHIAEDSATNSTLIELSTAPVERTDRFISHLSDLARGSDFWSAVRDAIGDLHDFVERHPGDAERIASSLFMLACANLDEMPDEFSFIYHFDDAFYLGREGIYGSEEAVYADFLAELAKHKKELNPESCVVAKPTTRLLLNKPD